MDSANDMTFFEEADFRTQFVLDDMLDPDAAQRRMSDRQIYDVLMPTPPIIQPTTEKPFFEMARCKLVALVERMNEEFIRDRLSSDGTQLSRPTPPVLLGTPKGQYLKKYKSFDKDTVSALEKNCKILKADEIDDDDTSSSGTLDSPNERRYATTTDGKDSFQSSKYWINLRDARIRGRLPSAQRQMKKGEESSTCEANKWILVVVQEAEYTLFHLYETGKEARMTILSCEVHHMILGILQSSRSPENLSFEVIHGNDSINVNGCEILPLVSKFVERVNS